MHPHLLQQCPGCPQDFGCRMLFGAIVRQVGELAQLQHNAEQSPVPGVLDDQLLGI